MDKTTIPSVIFAIKNPKYFLATAIGVIAIILIALLGPGFFNNLFGGPLSGMKIGTNGILLSLYSISLTGPILLYIVFINSKKFNLLKENKIKDDTKNAFTVVGKILTALFLVFFIFFSTTFISVDSTAITHKQFLIPIKEIPFNSVDSITATYSDGGNVRVYLNFDGQKELIITNGQAWGSNPYQDYHINQIFSQLALTINEINVKNSFIFVDNASAKELVEKLIPNSEDFTIIVK